MYGPEDSPQQTRIRTHIHAYLHTYTPRRQTTPPRLPSVFLLLDGALHGSSLPRPPYCRSIGDGEPDLPAPPIPPYRADGVHAYMLFLQLRTDRSEESDASRFPPSVRPSAALGTPRSPFRSGVREPAAIPATLLDGRSLFASSFHIRLGLLRPHMPAGSGHGTSQ